MALDESMSKEAEEYAKELVKKGNLVHSSNLKDGENLAMKCTSSGQEMTGQEATLNWYVSRCCILILILCGLSSFVCRYAKPVFLIKIYCYKSFHAKIVNIDDRLKVD